MESRTITVTASRQATLPVQFLRALGVEKGGQLYAVFDEKAHAIVLKSREQVMANMLDNIDRIRDEAISANPAIAKNIKKQAGKNFEEIRDEWADSPEGKTYFKEKYGITI